MIYEQIMLHCAYLKTVPFFCSQSYLQSTFLFVTLTLRFNLDEALVWKELRASLLLYLALLITLVTCCPQRNHRAEASFRYFSCLLCLHLLFSSSHPKIVWIFDCCTLSPATQEFHTKISIPLLPVNFTHRDLTPGVSFLPFNHSSRTDAVQFAEKTESCTFLLLYGAWCFAHNAFHSSHVICINEGQWLSEGKAKCVFFYFHSLQNA